MIVLTARRALMPPSSPSPCPSPVVRAFNLQLIKMEDFCFSNLPVADTIAETSRFHVYARAADVDDSGRGLWPHGSHMYMELFNPTRESHGEPLPRQQFREAADVLVTYGRDVSTVSRMNASFSPFLQHVGHADFRVKARFRYDFRIILFWSESEAERNIICVPFFTCSSWYLRLVGVQLLILLSITCVLGAQAASYVSNKLARKFSMKLKRNCCHELRYTLFFIYRQNYQFFLLKNWTF